MEKIKKFRTHIPLGVLLIVAFYMFGALVLIVSLFWNRVGSSRAIAAAHGLSPAVDGFILPIVAALAFLISFWLFTRSRWGYFLSMLYFIYFGGVSLWLISQIVQQPYLGNLIWAILVLGYLIWKRNYFLSPRTS